MFCSNCGAENISSAKFCKNCGKTIDTERIISKNIMKKPVEKFYLAIILVAIGAVLNNFIPLQPQVLGEGVVQIIKQALDAFSAIAFVYLIIATIQLIKYKIDKRKEAKTEIKS